jgi:hypothetical protein
MIRAHGKSEPGLQTSYSKTLPLCIWSGECIRKRVRRANQTEAGGWAEGMGLMCDGGLGVCAVWVIFGERCE